MSRDEHLNELIVNLRRISLNGDSFATVRAIRAKCSEAFIPFAESQLPFIDKDHMTESDYHTVELRKGALELRNECDNLLREESLRYSNNVSRLLSIRETFDDLCAHVENIYRLRKPDMLEFVEAVL